MYVKDPSITTEEGQRTYNPIGYLKFRVNTSEIGTGTLNIVQDVSD